MTRRMLSTIFVFSMISWSTLTSVVLTGHAHSAGVTLLETNNHGILLALSAPEYRLDTGAMGDGLFQRVLVPGAVTTAEPGRPELPVFNVLLGIPPDIQPRLVVLQDHAGKLPGNITPVPAPYPASITQDFEPGRYQMLNEIGDRSNLNQSMLYPEASARIADEAWIRDQRIIRLQIFPFQYDPAEQQLIWHRFVKLEIHFDENQSGPMQIRKFHDDSIEPVLRQNLLNYSQARFWRGIPFSASGDSPVFPYNNSLQKIGEQGARYRIGIDRDGLYRLTYETLELAGLPVESIDPATFNLSCQGRDVAIFVSNNDGNAHRFGSGEYLLFYGQKFRGDYLAQRYEDEDRYWQTFQTQSPDGEWIEWKPQFNAAMLEKYTDENAYWLTYGIAGAPRMQIEGSEYGIAPTPQTHRTLVHAEESHKWKTTLFNGEDTWFWDELKSSTPISRSYSIDLSFPATGIYTATLSGEVVAATGNNSASPDHHIQVYLNDPSHAQPTLEATWDGKSRYRFSATFPQATLIEGENQLDFVMQVITSSMLIDDLYFDWFEIDYARRFEATDQMLHFTVDQPGTWTFDVAGFDGLKADDVWVIDISDTLGPSIILNASLSDGEVRFKLTRQPGAQFYVGVLNDLPSEVISIQTPPDLNNPAEYILITPPELITATQVLADYRISQGLSAKVFNVQDLYDEFNDGIYHPIAIKNFLEYLFSAWDSRPPIYVVLIGDGHWNFKGFDGYDAPPIYMPPNLAWVDPWQGEVDSANLLATIVGDDPLADVFIGRIPVNNEDQLYSVIDKIIAYESSVPQEWQLHHLFITDNTPDPAGDFVGLSESIISDYTRYGMVIDRVYLNDFIQAGECDPVSPEDPRRCPQANQAILNDLNQSGALLVNYIGHASLNFWANEQIFTSLDIPLLDNAGQLPVVISMTCLDGYWIHPNNTSGSKTGPGLAEELLRADHRGAVATFSPTGLGVSTGHDAMQRGLYDALVQSSIRRLGEATGASKMSLYATGADYDLLHTFTIFGDPALRLAMPFTTYLPLTKR